MQLVLALIIPVAPVFLLRGQAREKSGIEVGSRFFVCFLVEDVTAMKILMTTIE